jgi:hypothetical protein
LDLYAAQYGVRTLSYYTFPDPRYGIVWNGVAQLGGTAAYMPAAAGIFQNENLGAAVPVANAYFYGANAVPAAGETTTPILTVNGQTAGVVDKKADGREYMALTFDNNPYLLHSLVFGYDLVNWVTKGLFIGKKKTYLSPEIDDIFLNSDLYSTAPGCQPPGFQIDPTVDLTAGCTVLRITGGDLSSLINWQNQVNSQYAASVKLTMAFNGAGTSNAKGAPATDDLTPAAQRAGSQFYWISHTYDHENLDCYNPVPNSFMCTPATYAQSTAEIDNNTSIARQLNLPTDGTGFVTPNVSGLANPNFMSAAVSRGIRYVVMDASALPASVTPNTGIPNAFQSSVLEIPRRPTNIFYNVTNPFYSLPGSEPDEYNYFYGPSGIIHVGGPGGPPFFNTTQAYSDILDRESQFILLNMLRGEAYPLMFHQANLSRYDGTNSLLTDLVGDTLAKFRTYSKMPLQSLPLSSIGQVLQDRLSFNASGVSATLVPGVSLTIQVSRSATIPITGLCGLLSNCDHNGAQSITYYNANPLLPTLVLLP